MSAPEWTYRHATEMRNHWWWRPGWSPGTHFYTWHITFDDASDLHALVDKYQAALAEHGGLDLVPRQWLHLTMQGVGFKDAVPPAQLNDIVIAVGDRLAHCPARTVTFEQPVIRPEAIALPALPPAEVNAIRDTVRAGLADVLDPDGVPETPDGFQPHVTIAYSRTTQPIGPYLRSLDVPAVRAVPVSISEVQLIELNRDKQMYEWEPAATALLKRSRIGNTSPAAES